MDEAVVIGVDMNVDDAEQAIARLKFEIKEFKKELAKAEAGRSDVLGIGAQNAEQYEAVLNWARDEIKVRQEQIYQLSQVEDKTKQIADNSERSSNHTSKFAKRIKSLLQGALVFGVISKAFSGLRSQLGYLVQGNEEAAAAVANFKNAVIGLVQPIVNAVLPALVMFLNTLTYIIRAISSLFGSTSDTTEALWQEKNALKQTGGAADKAGKQLAKFDEINKLSGSSGGGGGGAANASAFDAASIPDKLKAMVDGFVISFKDIFFDWGGDATPEDIAKKAIAALGAFIGGALGFSIGGVKGAVVGSLVGVLASIMFSNMIFDNDGKISKQEVKKLINAAIGGLIGGIAGIALTKSVKGALIGFTIGAVATMLIDELVVQKGKLNGKEKVKTQIASVLVGALGAVVGAALGGVGGALIGFSVGAAITTIIENIRAARSEKIDIAKFSEDVQEAIKWIQEQGEVVVDLKARISSITGEVDTDTQANFEHARELIDQIFTLNEEDNKTAEQIAVIRDKIDELNGLGFDVINANFKNTTDNYIIPERDAVQSLLDVLWKQLELEAAYDAIKEIYAERLEATNNEREAQEALNTLLEEEAGYKTSIEELTAARDTYGQAILNTQKYLDEGNQLTETQSELFELQQKKLKEIDKNLDDYNEKLNALQPYISEARRIHDEYSTALDTVNEKLVTFQKNTEELNAAIREESAKLQESGVNLDEGLTQGIEEGEQQALDAMKTVGEDLGDAFDEVAEINSPSEEYKEKGNYLMEGLAAGISENAYKPIDAMKAMLNDLITLAERGINSIVAKFNGMASDINSSSDGTPVQLLDRVNIPRLAQGAVIPANREFLAVLGDQKSGTNIETPLATMVQAFRTALTEMGYGGGQEAVMVVDGEVFGKLAYKLGGKEQTRVGVSLAGGTIV